MYLGVGLYVRNSVEAVALYQTAFGLELGYHMFKEDGTFFHSELCKNGDTVFCVVEAEADTDVRDNPVQLGYLCETKEELEKAFHILKENGTVKMDLCELPWTPYAGEVIDPFGIRWYLSVPGYRPPDDFTPNAMK